MAGRTVVEVAQRPIIVFGRSLMMSSLYKKRLDRVTLKALKSFDIESGGLSTPAKFLTSTEEVSSDKRRKNSAYLHFSLFIDTHYNRRSFPSGFLVQLMTPQPFFSFLMSRRPLAPTPWPLSESGAAKARFNSLARTAMNERQAWKKLDSKPPNTVCLFIWGSTRPGTGLRLLEVSLHDLWDRPKIIFGRYVPPRKKLPFGLKRPQRLFPVTIFMMNYLYLILKKVGSFFSVGVK